jgi:hypothetical protein
MRWPLLRRWVVGFALLAGLLLAAPLPVPAQAPTPRVIEIVMTPFKFEPSLIYLTEGETVIIRLVNADRGRLHNVAAAYLANQALKIRGDATEGSTRADG